MRTDNSDQTGRMLRLIWVFAGRTCHFVGFIMRWLSYCLNDWWKAKLSVFFFFCFFFFVFFFFSKILSGLITKTRLYKYIGNFTTKKLKIFSDKNSDIFHISAQNIDCGYSLEPPRRGGSNEYPQSLFWAEIRKIMYTPVNPSFTI